MADGRLDSTFAALAHPVRRDMLARLRRGPAPVSELAAPYDLSLPSVSRHLDVLEHAGLLGRAPEGRERICTLRPGALDEALAWLGEHRRFWAGALDSLAAHLARTAAPRRRLDTSKKRRPRTRGSAARKR